MPVFAQGQEPKRGRRSPWWLLVLILPALAVGALVVPFFQPVDFQVGPTAAFVWYQRVPPGGPNFTGSEDYPVLKDVEFGVGRHVYLLNGAAHLRYRAIGSWRVWVGWANGRRTRDGTAFFRVPVQ